jgi:hypothetical protein
MAEGQELSPHSTLSGRRHSLFCGFVKTYLRFGFSEKNSSRSLIGHKARYFSRSGPLTVTNSFGGFIIRIFTPSHHHSILPSGNTFAGRPSTRCGFLFLSHTKVPSSNLFGLITRSVRDCLFANIHAYIDLKIGRRFITHLNVKVNSSLSSTS